MRRTSIKPKMLYKIARELIKSYPNIKKYQNVGRPKKYNDSLILTILAIQNLYGFSFREVLEFSHASEYPNDKHWGLFSFKIFKEFFQNSLNRAFLKRKSILNF